MAEKMMADHVQTNWQDQTPPDLDAIEALALAAVASLPPAYGEPAKAVQLRVADFAPEEILDDLDVEDAFELTGFYEGVPMTEKSVMDMMDRPDTIWLFRRPLLDEWAERGTVSLGALVAHVVVHELAHHFGWSDSDISLIDRWWE